MERIAVLGAGSWGTALSLVLARQGCLVTLWARDSALAEDIRRTGQNARYLPGFEFPQGIRLCTSIGESIAGAEAIVLAVVSAGIAGAAQELRECLPQGLPIVSGTKGLDSETGLTVSQILDTVLKPGENPIAVLSGPNLAVELAKGIPTASVVASTDGEVGRQVQVLFMSPSLRVYTNPDVLGVELAGALKNVIAIGAGICDGMGFGDNTKAALLTRGLAEITRLGMRMGAQQATFTGLAGVGDLMATCASALSRNRRVGLGLAQGGKLPDVLREVGQVAEGVPTTRAARGLASKHDTPMPITEQVYQVLFEGKAPHSALADLMLRRPKDEVW